MAKIIRNLSTPESRKFWDDAKEAAKEVASWPEWKKVGIKATSIEVEGSNGYVYIIHYT